jgi:hypothetical protein
MTGRNIATPYWNVYFPQEGLLKLDGKVLETVKTVVLAKQL